MTKKLSKIWVDPEFKMMVKSRAAQNDMTIIDYTTYLANQENKNYKKNDKKKKLEFFF